MLLIKNFTKQKLDKRHLNKIAERTLEVSKAQKPTEISLVIVGEKRIRSLNKRFRGIDKVTDVLSFGDEETEIGFVSPPNDILYLGEIFICQTRAKKQAEEKKHSMKKEMTILFIHGILHLLGYDHKGDYKDSKMKNIEEKVLMAL